VQTRRLTYFSAGNKNMQYADSNDWMNLSARRNRK
jgi:hypothetical protein